MQTFLAQVTSSVLQKYDDLSSLCFVLPSKRAKLFLKNEFIKQLKSNSFLPKFYSIEEFVQHISGLSKIDSITAIFEFYKIYKELNPRDQTDSFDLFSKWGAMVLQDFNDIDSNLIEAKKFLKNVYETRKIENWNLDNNQTQLTNKYVLFLKNLEPYYTTYKKTLLFQNKGYNGLIYRIVSQKIDDFIRNNKQTHFVFAGFNALNKAEENIIYTLIHQNKADVYWDDDTFYEENNISAGNYFKKYKKNWPYYHNHSFSWCNTFFNKPKNIFIYGVPKSVSQIKKVGALLKEINAIDNLEQTAVILGNEQLLPILLNSLPKDLKTANITMGYALQNTPVSNLFHLLFKLHLNIDKYGNAGGFYYKDFLSLIQHPSIQLYWHKNSDLATYIKELIYDLKTIFIGQKHIDKIIEIEASKSSIFDLLFRPLSKKINLIINRFISIIEFLKLNSSLNILDEEYLFRFLNIFQQLSNYDQLYGYINNVNTLYSFFKTLLKTESLSFQGEPLKGLQIMGLLESRTLDFENVIISSVNEGYIPSSKNQNSFIPFDLKVEFGLPTAKENDAIFAYHFFRLFHRSKNIYLLYNTETDDFGTGEQSRFITQIEIAKKNGLLPKVNITKCLLSPKLNKHQIDLKSIKKNKTIILKLKELAKSGFSPSSLTAYIRNPIDFYKNKVLKIKEFNSVEETIASNTFGTIIHDTLENLYAPFKNVFLTIENINQIKKRIREEVKVQFKNHYTTQFITSGKNYLTYEIATQFVLNFLNFEITELKKNKQIKILDLELDIKVPFQTELFDFPIFLKGKIDRIDEVDGVLRIIDYKTGKVESRNLSINDWDLLCVDEKFSKSFQLLCYTFMYVHTKRVDLNKTVMESGIISFKNLNNGFLKLNKSPVSKNDLQQFSTQLENLLAEIFNLNIDFKEKEINLQTIK